MKNSLRLIPRLLLIWGLVLNAAFWQACSPGFLESDPANAPLTEGILTLEYEAEVLTWQEAGDPAKTSPLDKIHGMAHAVRSKVHAEVYEDGTSAWRIEKMEPQYNVKIPDQTPPDPTPQTKITRIDRTGNWYNTVRP